MWAILAVVHGPRARPALSLPGMTATAGVSWQARFPQPCARWPPPQKTVCGPLEIVELSFTGTEVNGVGSIPPHLTTYWLSFLVPQTSGGPLGLAGQASVLSMASGPRSIPPPTRPFGAFGPALMILPGQWVTGGQSLVGMVAHGSLTNSLRIVIFTPLTAPMMIGCGPAARTAV